MHLPLPITLLRLDAAKVCYGVHLHKDNTCCPWLLGPPMLKCWTLRSWVFDRGAEMWARNTVSGLWLSEIGLACLWEWESAPTRAPALWTNVVFMCLSAGFDRQISRTSYSKMFVCKLLFGHDPLSPGRWRGRNTKKQHSWERLETVRKLSVMWIGFLS